MRTNYHLKSSNRTRKEYVLILYIILFFMVLLFGIHFLFPQLLPGIFSAVAYPFYRGEQAVSEEIDLARLSKSELLAKNEELERKVTELENKDTLSPTIVTENIELKELFARSPEHNLVLARVLVKPPVTLYDMLVVDVGYSNGIEVGDKVYVDGDVLLGEVAEVGHYSSKVKLFSSPGEKIEVSLGEEGVHATANGRGSGNFDATVPRELNIKEGDAVIVPSIKPTLFANVNSIISDPARAFELILFKSPVNIQLLKWVLISKQKI